MPPSLPKLSASLRRDCEWALTAIRRVVYRALERNESLQASKLSVSSEEQSGRRGRRPARRTKRVDTDPVRRRAGHRRPARRRLCRRRGQHGAIRSGPIGSRQRRAEHRTIGGRRRAGDRRVVEPSGQRPGQGPAGHPRPGVHGRAPECDHQLDRPRERGAQDQDRHGHAGRHPAGRLPVVGRRRPRRAGGGGTGEGHHRRCRAVGRHDERGRHGHLPDRRQAIRHPLQLRDGRLLVQQGALRAGRHHRDPDDLG